MRKQPTPEQKARAEERRAKFQQLWRAVRAIPELERVEMANRLGLRTCEGHELSLCNHVLVMKQLPAASVVCGFRQWLKHGRAVRKGEHGAMIWVPTGARNGENDGTKAPATDGTEGAELRFLIGTVFDIGQTEEIGTEAA